MQTRSSSRLISDQSSNPTSSTNPNQKGRNRRRSKQRIENSNLEAQSHPIVTMADNRTMAELLRALTEGYAEAIVVPLILAEQFELKHSLINMMTTDQFFGLEKDNPHDHIRWFNKITSTIKYKDVPSSAIKLMLFPFSLAGAARRWLEKEPSRLINTWEDLVSKFINEFFPPSRTTNLRNEISNFQQRFDESFHEAWDRYKDLLHQDSLNATAGGNLLERSTQDVLTIIENKSKVHNSRSKPIVSQVKACDVNSNSSEIAKLTHAVNQRMNVVTIAMTAILKQFQATSPPAPVKAVEETCVTCGGAHPYYQCLAAGGNTFPEFRDNIQGYVAAAAVNYNQSNPGYRPPGLANQIRPPGFAQPNVQNNQNRFGPPQGFNRGNEQSYQALASQNQNVHLNELEKVRRMNEANMKAMQTQIDMVKNELRNEMKSSIQTSLSNQTNEIKNMMASLLQINTASISGSGSLPSNTVANPKGELKAITTRSGLVINGPTVPTPSRSINLKEDERVEETSTDPNLAEYTIKKMLKALLSNKEKLQELANTPLNENCSAFTFPADFVIVDYESDPRVPLILGRPFLRTARALIDVHGKEMILRDGDERLTLNMRHDTSSYSNQPQKELINLINVFNNSSEDFLEDLFPYQPSGNPTFMLHLELTSPEVNSDIFNSEGCNEFADELPSEYNDNLQFDIESDLKEIELLLYQDKDSSLKDSIDQKNRANLADIFVDSIPEMFTDEHTLDYSPPPIFDVYDDDFLEVESDARNVYDDPFDSKGEKIKESKLLIDELDLPCDFLPPSELSIRKSSRRTKNDSVKLEFDIEFDLKEIEFLLYQGKDSNLKDSIVQTDLANLDDYFVDPTPEMFTDERAPDYSSPPIFDVYDDDFLEVESDAENIYNDPFDSKGEKIKESKLLIDELDLPCDFHPPPNEDLGKLQPTADIGIFVGYAPSRKGYRIYNKRTRHIMETINIQFDELSEPMAPVQLILVPVNSAGTPSSTSIDQDAPSPSHSPSSSALQSPCLHQGVAAESTLMDENPFAPIDNDLFINIFALEPTSEASSSGDASSAESTDVTQTLHHLKKWSKDHLTDNVIGNPSRLVSTKK
nr:hypothetical protein [Tanacetum cinerariifolium]